MPVRHRNKKQNMSYKNKNILIIGASFGIGAELATQLVKEEANLALIARSQEKLDEIIKEIDGKNHISLPCDVTDISELEKSAKELSDKFFQIDLIIFCVGVYEPMNLENFDLKKTKNILNVNLGSFLNVIHAFLPQIKDRKIKHFAVVSSVAGYFGMPNSLAYGASKAGLSNLTESLFYELKKYNIKTQLINPGFVKTRLTDKNEFKMPGIISADKAASTIIKGLKSNKFEIAFPFVFASIMGSLKAFPHKIRQFLLLRVVR